MKASVSEPTATDLKTRIERWIEQRTGGRVHSLCVENAGGSVIVHGYAGSYYVRQLALAAVFEALEAVQLDPPGQVKLDIEVGV